MPSHVHKGRLKVILNSARIPPLFTHPAASGAAFGGAAASKIGVQGEQKIEDAHQQGFGFRSKFFHVDWFLSGEKRSGMDGRGLRIEHGLFCGVVIA